MTLFIIAGFLGSGKTSLLLTIAKALAENGKKIAVIENEVGKVGVDGVTLQGEGLTVKEIFSGCVCCSLRVDLINTLLSLEREFNPDVVILEPSGVASPRQVALALTGYSGEIDAKYMVVIVDASRFMTLENLDIPIIRDGLDIADLLVINKCDLVDAEQLAAVNQRIAQYQPPHKIINVSALNQWHTDALCQALLSLTPEQTTPLAAIQPERLDGIEPTVLSRNFILNFSSPVTFASATCLMLKNIVEQLQQADCTAIGHVKCVVKAEEGGYLMFSITDFNAIPYQRGKLSSNAANLQFVLNTIVYGVNQDILRTIVNTQLESFKQSLT
jgi:G3E family GTPase